MTYTVGVDLGKQGDYTAINILETVPVAGQSKPQLHVVYLKRLRGVAYPLVIDEVAGMARWPALRGAKFAVDATGLGRPIVDALREKVGGLNAITITGGESVGSPAPGEWTVPKADLIASVQLLLQGRRLRIHDHLAEVEALKSELLNFGYQITESGRTTMAAVSGHDDLVLSVAMACWLASRDLENGAQAWTQFMRNRAGLGPPSISTHVESAPLPTREEARIANFREQRGKWTSLA